jgi:hypothetical protein
VRARAALAIALTAGLAASGTALAAPKAPKLPKAKPLAITDQAGDANGINGQGVVTGTPDPATAPASRAAADIVSWGLGREDDGKVVKAFTATMTLSSAPDQATQYRIRLQAPACTTWFIEYQFPPTGAEAAITKGGLVRENCSGAAVFTDVTATIKGNTISWRIPVKGMPGGVKLGDVMTVVGAEANLETAAVIPALDIASAAEGTSFKIGQ